MARIYTNQSIAGAGLQGFLEGQKMREDEEFRNREQLRNAEEFAAQKYLKALKDKQGKYSGLEENTDFMERDRPVAEQVYPDLFSKTEQEASPASFVTETDRLKDTAIKDMGSSGVTQTPPPPQPQVPIVKPLLKSKESARQEVDMAMQSSKQENDAKIAEGNIPTSVGQKKLVGQEDGVDKFEQPANTRVDFEDAFITPEKPKIVNRFNPSPIAMSRIMEGITQRSKDPDAQMVVPPELRGMAGLSPDFDKPLKTSILKELLQLQSKKFGTQQDKVISPDVLPFVDKARSGAPLGQTIQEAMQAKGGTLNDAEVRAITGQSNQNSADKRFGLQQQKAAIEQKKLSPKVEEKVNALENVKSYLEQAKELVNSGKVKPRPALDIARRFGVYGGVASDVVNTALKAAGQEPLTVEELQFLKLTAKANLDELVSTAGTTFTTRFEDKISSLGTDVSNPKRFNQSIDALIKEADREKNNAIGIGQANKEGKIKDFKPAGDENPTSKSGKTVYSEELRKARALLSAFRDVTQARMLREKRSVGWASQEIDKKKKQLNEYFGKEYGKGFEE